MSKQTAVEWIEQQVKQQGITHYFSLTEILKQAKKMEWQQIVDAKDCWFEDERDGEQYYNETYKPST